MERNNSRTQCRQEQSHKIWKNKLEKLETAVSAVPQSLKDYLDFFTSFCEAGTKLASLLETLFQDTPLLCLALRFREACEELSDKCNKTGLLLKQEITAPVKRIVPGLSKLRSRLNSHAHALAKYESYQSQLEALKSQSNPSKQKLEHVEDKFQNYSMEFAKEDTQLACALDELYNLRVEVRLCADVHVQVARID